MKAGRNKTIDISAEEGAQWLERCLRLEAPATVERITDKTILGDSFEAMKLLPPCFASLVIADPPYNLDKEFSGDKFCRMTDGKYAEYTERWLCAVLPLMKEDATLYVCCDWRTSPVIYSVLKKHMTVRNRITWQREKGRGALRNWKNAMEDIWFATKSSDYFFAPDAVMQRRRVLAPYRREGLPKDWEETEQGNFRNTFPSNFWDDISVPYWSMPENTAHPTQKPEKLLAKLILASSRPGETVFDPFLGSGSTSVAAKKLGRHYVGIERSAQYCAWAELRLEAAERDSSIQGYTNGVFWERNTLAAQRRKT